jgi:hypothetical protein
MVVKMNFLLALHFLKQYIAFSILKTGALHWHSQSFNFFSFKKNTMSFATPWVNSYNSIIKLEQDPTTGMLTGTYASTTGGTGTYDVVGWASLQDATTKLGQTMAISILWRSNDGGKSDPSHEVSGMAGQLLLADTQQNLTLNHIFVETKPDTIPQTGFYPDKLIFTPVKPADINTYNSMEADFIPATAEMKENLAGTWIGSVAGQPVEIGFEFPDKGGIQLAGTITYQDGKAYPIVGFTDIFALTSALNLQGISFSTYVDSPDGRKCISMAGHLNLATGKIALAKMQAQSTPPDSTWYSVHLEQCHFEKKQISH